MFNFTPANMPYYLRFVERYASYGYALAFSQTGDFFEAQSVLERAFAQGYPLWAGRFARNRDTEDTLRKLLEKQVPLGAGPRKSPAVATFSNSRKLLEVQQAQELLLSFPGDQQVALFLEIVEEVPRERVARLLGKPVEWFEELQVEVQKGVRQWRPDDAGAMEVFARQMRQYRLPPSFLNNIESKMDYSWRRSFNGAALIRNALIAVGVVVIIISLSAGSYRANRAARGDYDNRYYGSNQVAPGFAIRDSAGGPGGTGHMLLWIDLMIVAAILALRRGLERTEGEGLSIAGEYDGPLTSLSILHTFGVILVTAGAVYFVMPSAFSEPWVPLTYLATHALFLPMAAAGIMRVFLRILLHREGRSGA